MTRLQKILDVCANPQKSRNPDMDDVDQLLLELASIGGVTFKASDWQKLRLYVNCWVAKLDKDRVTC